MESKIKTIVITGPTAVGKSDTAIAIAQKLGLEVISADSLQVYKKLNIGTSKPPENDLRKVKHHCIDIVEPDEEFNASIFAEITAKLENENKLNTQITLICGGTGLFIETFLNNYSCSIPSDVNVREKFNEIARNEGLEGLYQELECKDPEYARKITVKDRQKIVRALEVEEITQKPFSTFHQQENERNLDETLYIVLSQERKTLYERINHRVDLMMEAGFMDEVEYLMKAGYDRNLKPLKSIGYNELIAYHYGEMSLEEALEKIKTNSRRLAKRQFTWHRRHPEAIYIDIDEKKPVDKILSLIK